MLLGCCALGSILFVTLIHRFVNDLMLATPRCSLDIDLRHIRHFICRNGLNRVLSIMTEFLLLHTRILCSVAIVKKLDAVFVGHLLANVIEFIISALLPLHALFPHDQLPVVYSGVQNFFDQLPFFHVVSSTHSCLSTLPVWPRLPLEQA